MKWTSKVLGADLNESKLIARGDNPDNLFEIIPKFQIEIEDRENYKLGKGGKIFATTTGGHDEPIGIALGSQFLILNKGRDAVEKTIELEASIDVVVWLKSVFILGLSNSEIQLICPYTYQCKESRKVSSNPDLLSQGRFFVDAFIHSNPDPTKIDLIAMGIDGSVYSFQNVSLIDGTTMDYTLDENITLEIDLSTIKGTVKHYLDSSAHVLSVASPSRNFLITGEENGRLSMFELSNEEESRTLNFGLDERFYLDVDLTDLLEFPPEIKIKKIARCEGLLFVLFTNGHLEILLDNELFPTGQLELPEPHHIVQDFAMVIHSTDMIKMWVIYSDPRQNEHFIGIFPGPTFTAEFSAKIPVPEEIATDNRTEYSFPKQSNPLDEPTTVLAIGPDGSTTLYHMSECSTDISLQNLLAKSRFEKAELLAKKYGKDLDLVWKAKVRVNFNEVVGGKSTKTVEKAYRELVSTLQLIQDAEFVCTFCTNREKGIPKLEWVKELLALGLKRVAECSSSEAGRTLLLTWKKLYTFDQVLSDAGVGEWNQFNDEQNTMFAQCLWFLELNQFKKCEIVWLRHSDEFIPHVDLHNFVAFFKVLFEQRLNSDDAISLYKTILPFAMEKCESETSMDGNQDKIDAFLGLIRSQIRSLERENGWPDEAIVFTNILLKIMQEEYVVLEEEKSATGEAKVTKKLNICDYILKGLKKLLQALVDLSVLKKSHSVRIPFEKYITESSSDIVNSMLKLLFAKDEVERYVNKFLRPFASRNDLNMDLLFEGHVQSAVDDVQYFLNSGAIPFEERLVSLIGFIESPKIKLACVLRMTEEWPVPWMPLMKGIVTNCLQMKITGPDEAECKSLQKTIRLMETQVPYRCLLHKYRLTASKLIRLGVYVAIQRILKSKKADCWEDCIELIKHTKTYTKDGVTCIKFWEELSTMKLPLDDVTYGDSSELKLRFLRRVMHKFRNGTNQSEEPPEMWERFTEYAKILANQTNDDKTMEFLNLRKLFPNLWDDNIVHSSNYPFTALELLFPQVNSLTSAQIIGECDKLSVLSFTNANDILVMAAAFLSGPGNLGSAFQKIWDIVDRIVKTPKGFSGGNADFVVPTGLQVAHYLILYAPTTSSENLNILFQFCVRLEEAYEDAVEAVAKLQTVIWIFQELRETEVPLEREFLALYKAIWREGMKNLDELKTQLTSIGQVILRFGNTDLLTQIFNGVHQELMNQSISLFGDARIRIEEGAICVHTLKDKLLSDTASFDVKESNIRVQNLVKALAAAQLPMNAYALRERNKEKLINKLLEMNLFPLAAQTALVFDFRELPSWSNILQEYINKATIAELKTLLESLKKITDLWVIPEFSTAWLKVSEKFPNFRHMCPIPLNG